MPDQGPCRGALLLCSVSVGGIAIAVGYPLLHRGESDDPVNQTMLISRKKGSTRDLVSWLVSEARRDDHHLSSMLTAVLPEVRSAGGETGSIPAFELMALLPERKRKSAFEDKSKLLAGMACRTSTATAPRGERDHHRLQPAAPGNRPKGLDACL
jgi:hypothetical protein